MTTELLVVACAFSFVAVLVLVPPVSVLARRVGAVAWPRSDRWNQDPVPTIGGLAISAGLILGGIALVPSSPPLGPFCLGVAIMAAVGLSDDLRGLRPRVRVIVEVLVGIAFVLAVRVDVAPVVIVLGAAIAALAFPLAMNATNLVDNADGLAASLSAVAGAVIAVGALIGDADAALGASAIVVSACIAFLFFNWPPARIFMGDSGSLSVGFALAAASTLLIAAAATSGVDDTAKALAIVIAAWAVQSGDVVLVIVMRRRRAVPIWQGGVDHSSHRLMASGLSARQMLVALVGLAASGGAFVLVAAAVGDGLLAMMATGIVLVVIAIVEALIARVHVSEPVTHNMAVGDSPDGKAPGS